MRRLLPGRRPADERGIVVIWVAVCMVVFLGFAAWAVDYAHWNSERSRMQKAADAAALAGAVYLPDDPGGAVAAAQTVAAQNGFSGGVSASVGSNPNQLKVTVGQSVRNTFGVAIGVGQTNLSRHAVAEYESPQPLDMVLVVDRTRSMLTPSAATLQNLKDATLDLFGYMDPRNESIALGVLGPSDRTKTCTGANAGAYGVASAVSDVTAPSNTWMAAPFPTAPPVTDYRNASSQIVKTVKCLATANSPLGFTDLGDPIAAATTYLNTHGRPGSKRGIILMTDGAANLPTGTQPCGYANTKASAAKAAGIQVLTIGFLSGSNRCTEDSSGSFRNAQVTTLLASMASPIKGVAARDDGCTTVENTDGDNFFCQPKTEDLSTVFLQAAAQLAGRLPRIVE